MLRAAAPVADIAAAAAAALLLLLLLLLPGPEEQVTGQLLCAMAVYNVRLQMSVTSAHLKIPYVFRPASVISAVHRRGGVACGVCACGTSEQRVPVPAASSQQQREDQDQSAMAS
jgi:hypothetical protein